jgi:hypothetical protein
MRRGATQLVAAGTALLLSCAAGATGKALQVVARTTAASGSNLYVLRYADSKIDPLRKGDKIYFGDIVSAGPGSSATLALSQAPKSTAASTDLFDVSKELSAGRPIFVARQFGVLAAATRTHSTLKLRRTGSFVDLTLSR